MRYWFGFINRKFIRWIDIFRYGLNMHVRCWNFKSMFDFYEVNVILWRMSLTSHCSSTNSVSIAYLRQIPKFLFWLIILFSYIYDFFLWISRSDIFLWYIDCQVSIYVLWLSWLNSLELQWKKFNGSTFGSHSFVSLTIFHITYFIPKYFNYM